MNPIPIIPKDLVEFLDGDQMHSAKASLPRTNDTDRDIWIKVGKRQLVEFLIQTRKDQETGADEGFPHVFTQRSASGGSPDDHAGTGSPASPGTGSPGPYPAPADRLGRFSQ